MFALQPTMEQEAKVDRYLGLEIRRRRVRKGKTLAEAAGGIGVSSSLLSQIERGIVNPSICTLHGIAHYLEAPIGVLLGESLSRGDAVVEREITRTPSRLRAEGVEFHVLPPSDSALQSVYYQFEPLSSTGDEPYRHEGEECIFVLKGEFEVTVGDKKFALKEGDYIWFCSTLPHKMRNLVREESAMIVVGTPPQF